MTTGWCVCLIENLTWRRAPGGGGGDWTMAIFCTPKNIVFWLLGAWRDHDPNDIYTHCTAFYFFWTSKFITMFVLLNNIPRFINFFKNSFRKKEYNYTQ